eukprot:sb/3473815/
MLNKSLLLPLQTPGCGKRKQQNSGNCNAERSGEIQEVEKASEPVIDFPAVTTDKNSRKVEATTPQIEGIKLPMIVELGVDPTSSKPILMSITPAIKLEDIPDRGTTTRSDRSRAATDRTRSPNAEDYESSRKKREVEIGRGSMLGL